MALFVLITAVLVSAGVLMTALAVAYRLPQVAARRIFDDQHRKLHGRAFQSRVFANMALSTVFVYALAFVPYPFLFHQRDRSWIEMLAQAIAILLIYDLGYYAMHRFVFHRWTVMKRVHAVHHRVRHPNAFDSLYLHPLESFCGLALLALSTAIVGPVHVVAFAGVFAVYSYLNILVHSGLDLPFFPFRLASYLARRHDTHHTTMQGGGNFASIITFYDRIFGTAVPGVSEPRGSRPRAAPRRA